MRLFMQRFIKVFSLLSAVLTASSATQYFISTTGIDTNSGTITSPFLTISKALGSFAAGDTIYVRGGTYIYTGSSTAISLPLISGSSTSIRCNLIAYPGERVLLDFSAMTGTSADGLKINGSYWYIKGFDCKGAPHNGIKISGGTYNIIEFCTSFENRNTGVQLASSASYNRFINCDSYYNYDPPLGGNSDGFSPKLDVGTGNFFSGCRSWQNSDDGWDGYLRPSDSVYTTLENCWSFMNGYLKDGSPITTGNGNGFKMGGGDTSNIQQLRHYMTLKNCLCFDNRVKGYDQNNNRGSMTLINCTGFRNGSYNFSVPGFIRTSDTLTVENCISLASSGVTLSGVPNPILATNSWASPFTGATAADFISIDTTGVRGPRKPDGSLPDITFMHLVSTSQFVNKGTNVGIAYIGTAPDLGCFESSFVTGVTDQSNASIPNAFTLYQNYPNPFNPSTEIRYSVPTFSIVKLSIYNILGQEVAILVNEQMQPGNYSIQWNASSMSSGLYFTRLSVQTWTGQPFLQTRKMLLTK
jgi:hypothetical protein